MNESAIELDVYIDFRDYWRATFRYILRSWKFKALVVGSVLSSLMFLVLCVRYPYSKPSYELLMPLVALAFVLAVFYLNTKYLFSSKKFLQHNVRYTFSEEGVDAVAESSPGYKSWGEIPKAYELADDFLVFYTPERMYTIPKRCFQDAEQITRFRALLNSRLGSKAKLR